MKKILVALIAVLSLTAVCYSAEYDGYVVTISNNTATLLSENISMFSNAMLASDLTDSETVELIADEIDSVKEIDSEHMLVKVDDMSTLEELISLGIVDTYEKNIYLELHGYDVTLNEYYDNQKWYLDMINADFAWNAGVFGSDVLVGVIDSGVSTHSDLIEGINVHPGKNYVEGSDEKDTNDEHYHGTFVSSLIASRCNSFGIVGVAFKSKIVPLKVTNEKELTLDYAIAAIYDAVRTFECDVINLSFGVSTESKVLRDAVDYAINNNVIVVASAGNHANSGYEYPAAFDEVISVANAQQNGFISSSSQRNDKVDIAAPGSNIASLSNKGVLMTQSGTSFSAPMVSAAAALAKSINPDISQQEFESLLKLSADSSYLSSSGQGTTAWGAGMLDIEALIKLMLSGENCYVSKPYTVENNTFVNVTNLSDTDAFDDCVVTIIEYNSDGSVKKSMNLTVDIAASDTIEIPLTQYGFSSLVEVKTSYDRIPGDINGDKSITVRDASIILRFCAGYTVDVPESIMDVDGSGAVTVKDASLILRYCAEYDVVFKK